MSLINTVLNNLNPPQDRREQLKEIDGTPSYVRRNSSLDAGKSWILNLSDDYEIGKWTPLNLVVIDNQSTQDLELRINQNKSQGINVISNATKTVKKEGINSLEIINKGSSTVNADDLELILTRDALTSDEQMRKRKKRVLNL